MSGADLVVRTRLIPPRLPRRWLRRTRLDQQLAAAAEYPVTVICASAGYGKSSALASFAARGGWPTIWYSLGEDSADPLVFLLHLVHACRSVAPRIGAHTCTLLEQRGPSAAAWSQALDALINDLVLALEDETILILDDEHAVDDLPDVRALIERLLARRPPLLHVLIATRAWPQLASLPILQARGELFVVGEADLAFSAEETAALFATVYDRPFSTAEALEIHEQTGGWPIALQLVGQGAPGRAADDKHARRAVREYQEAERAGDHPAVSSFIARLSSLSREALFTYLAHEVLARQPADIQAFLLRSAILAELEPGACDAILGLTTSATLLRALERRGLFLTATGAGRYRFHPLFHAFLQERARSTLADWAGLHRRAAAYFQAAGADEQVLYHLLAIGDDASAARVLADLAQGWLEHGRLVTLLAWIGQLPEATLRAHPQLLLARGEAARLLARFEQALQAYAEAGQLYRARADTAGQARALRGQAQVYLDTVQPAMAEEPLRQAFRLLRPAQRAERAALLRLIAENRLNRGRAGQAARLYRLASRLGDAAAAGCAGEQQPRLLLRMGRLDEARTLLETELLRADAPAVDARPTEAHREATMLLSLIGALQGEAAMALRYAEQGLAMARQLGATLFEAVAHMRAGHALQLSTPPAIAAANQHYLQAMALADALGIQRTKAEAYLGLALLHGFNGELAAAQAAARAGLAIVEHSGDAWVAALLWTALGAAGAVNGAPETLTWLGEALVRFQRGPDTYGQAVVQLWLTIWYLRAGRPELAARHAHELIALVQRYDYAGLVTRPTLFGPRDRMLLVPPLLLGRADPQWHLVAQQLLARGFPAIAADESIQTYHPGSTLRIQALGPLRVWRGAEAIEPRAWQRRKAAQMLGVLLTNRHRWLLREQICEWLWPEEDAASAETQFKVTLNALNTALEPTRPPRTPPFYIRRQGGAYRFCPPDGAWLDVAEFEALIDAAQTHLAADDLGAAQQELAVAVSLYRDDYLSEYVYEDWAREERERLRGRYLEAATTLAEVLARQNRLAEAIQLCETILARDPCWEPAYGILMRVYAHQGNRRQALATYERCVRNLRTYLDMAPLPQTRRLYEAVMR